ncbi:MAG: SiaB family protein kinase, partial [Bacteroidales bacterium]|nr:SiaB family protein kinase [Bacteroidales bacterium]
MSLDVNQLYVKVCGTDAFFAFKGEITSERINAILEEIESKWALISSEVRMQKKIYNILVECLQNLYHHSDEVPVDLIEQLGNNFGMVVLKKLDNGCSLKVGNFVLNDKVKFLSEKIEKLNSLSTEALKEMYKFILTYQKLSPKGGGGLGLIDIARKSNHH